MTDRVRKTALCLTWTLAACHRGGPGATEPTPPGPIAELDAAGGELPIVLVPQSAAAETEIWMFEPGGKRLASIELGGCSVWDIESGRLIRTMGVDGEPCTEWVRAVGFDDFLREDSSADGVLTLDTSSGVAIEDVKTGKKLRDLPCSDCADVDHIAWSDKDHQVALVWQDTARLEIWDADAGTLVRAETIPILGELQELTLGWTQAGATVNWTAIGFPIECGSDASYNYYGDCEWDEEQEISMRRSNEHEILAFDPSGGPGVVIAAAAPGVAELSFDPEFRWVFWTEQWSERRGGTTTTMHVEGLAGSTSALGWETEEGFDEYDDWAARDGRWHSDGATHWVVSITHQDYDGTGLSIEWETTMTSPAIGRRAGSVLEALEYDSTPNVELFGFSGDAIGFSGEVCGESCTQVGVPLKPGCTVRDIASGHGAVLLDCDGTANLRVGGTPKPLPIDAKDMWWTWFRGGALAIWDGKNFVLVDAVTNTATKPRYNLLDLFEARLGPELERMVVVDSDALELIESGQGEVILRLPKLAPQDVALSPSGDRLAVLGDGQIRVFAVPSGDLIVSWASEGVELAFRQDGAAIFVGNGQPEQAFDASTGKPLKDPSLARITAAIDGGGEIDPSWRWIMNDERGELTRTLDGRVLTWRDGGVWLTDTGQYQGQAPGPELAFRVGKDPWAVPSFDAEDLAKWLERPDLVEAFATGQAIKPPRMTAAEFAGVQAKAPKN